MTAEEVVGGLEELMQPFRAMNEAVEALREALGRDDVPDWELLDLRDRVEGAMRGLEEALGGADRRLMYRLYALP